jgi:drug/metabolite transporter (DMT)-like permease
MARRGAGTAARHDGRPRRHFQRPGLSGAGPARERRIGFACAFGVLFVWAGFLLTARLSPQQGLAPIDTLMLRHGGAFLAALVLVAVRGWPRLPAGRAAVLTLFAGFGFPYAAYLAFTFAPAAHGGVMLPGLLPFHIALVWWLAFGEGWTHRRAASLALVAAGIALLAFDTFGAHPGAWRGDLIFLAGGLSWAIYMAFVRAWGVRALDATLAVALYAAPVTLVVWWVASGMQGFAAVPAGALAFQLVYQGVFAVLVAGFLFTRAMNALGAATTSTITSLVPGMTALAAWPLLGEPLGIAGLAGVAVVTAGMVFGVAASR